MKGSQEECLYPQTRMDTQPSGTAVTPASRDGVASVGLCWCQAHSGLADFQVEEQQQTLSRLIGIGSSLCTCALEFAISDGTQPSQMLIRRRNFIPSFNASLLPMEKSLPGVSKNTDLLPKCPITSSWTSGFPWEAPRSNRTGLHRPHLNGLSLGVEIPPFIERHRSERLLNLVKY